MAISVYQVVKADSSIRWFVLKLLVSELDNSVSTDYTPSMISFLQTLEIAVNAHEGHRDKVDRPYIMHPFRVSLRLQPTHDRVAILAALLHDVLEDTGVTVPVKDPTLSLDVQAVRLKSLGVDLEIVEAVRWVSREPNSGLTYKQWIKSIATDGPLSARLVKLADFYDNSSPERMRGLPKEMQGIVNRYKDGIEILRPAIPPELFELVQSGDLVNVRAQLEFV